MVSSLSFLADLVLQQRSMPSATSLGTSKVCSQEAVRGSRHYWAYNASMAGSSLFSGVTALVGGDQSALPGLQSQAGLSLSMSAPFVLVNYTLSGQFCEMGDL